MTAPRPRSPHSSAAPDAGPRRRTAGTHRVAALALAFSVTLGLAQTPARPPASPPAAAGDAVQAPATVPPKPPPKTPRQFAEHLLTTLRNPRTPWQCYSVHVKTLEDYAAREAAVRTGNSRIDANQVRLAAHLRQMARLLEQMAEQSRIRAEIRLGRYKGPFELREKTYAAAGTEHRRLLTEFARLGAALPTTSLAAPAP